MVDRAIESAEFGSRVSEQASGIAAPIHRDVQVYRLMKNE
jgi:hypothetical protein